MRRFYALLRITYGEPADPAGAAQREVEWWAVHRAHQKGEQDETGPLVDALSALYAYVYGTGTSTASPAPSSASAAAAPPSTDSTSTDTQPASTTPGGQG